MNPKHPSPSKGLEDRLKFPNMGLEDRLNQALSQLKETKAERDRLQGRLDEIERARALEEKKARIMSAIEALSPRDPQLILRLIDPEQVRIGEKGVPEGLNEQLNPLRERAPYLFLEAVDPAGGSPESGDYEEEFDMNAFLRGER